MKIIKYILFAFIYISCQYSYSQLYTEYAKNSTIDSLVQNVFASPSVQILNISYTGDYRNLIDEIWDIGYFNSVNSTVGLDSGIILTGGWLSPPYGLGQPSINNPTYFKTTVGDSTLDNIITPSTTLGAAILEFDFIPNGDSIKFNYVFASDEYPHQICTSDRDVFAFHISGAGITGTQNIALVPNTNIFVGNNSINDTSFTSNAASQIATGLCQSLDYPQYYVDHGNDNVFVFNGTTTVLTAKSKTVPCQTYHLRFAIANGGNDVDESPAVFLEANSFNSEPLKIESEVSYGGVDTVLYEGCGSVKIIFRRTYNIQQPKTYNISVLGTAQNGIDYNNLPTSITMQGGCMYDTLFIYPTSDLINDDLESIIITIGDTLCNGQYYETDIELIIYEKPNFNIQIIPDTGTFCDSVLFSAQIQGALPPLSYNWNNGLGNDSLFSFYPNFQGFYTNKDIQLTVTDACGNTTNDLVNVIFAKYPIADFTFSPSYSDLLNPLVEFIDLSSNDVVNWNWSFGENTNSYSEQNPQYNYTDTGSYHVSLFVSNQFNCADSITKTVTINDISTLYIPNTFTPNRDGMNDVFKIIGNEIKEFDISIFNRWGEKIFESKSQDNSWDGKYSQTETYTYKITVKYKNNRKETKIGEILLLK